MKKLITKETITTHDDEKSKKDSSEIIKSDEGDIIFKKVTTKTVDISVDDQTDGKEGIVFSGTGGKKTVDDIVDEEDSESTTQTDDGVQVIKKVITRRVVTTAEDKEDDADTASVIETDDGVRVIKKIITKTIVTAVEEQAEESGESGETKTDEDESQTIKEVICKEIVTTLEEQELDQIVDTLEADKEHVQIIKKIITKETITPHDGEKSKEDSSEIKKSAGDEETIEEIVTTEIFESAEKEIGEEESTQVTETVDGDIKVIKTTITRKIIVSGDDEDIEGCSHDEDEEEKTERDLKKSEGPDSTEVTETDDGGVKVIKTTITRKIIVSGDDDDIEECRHDEEEKVQIEGDSKKIGGDESTEVTETVNGDGKIIKTTITRKIIVSEDDEFEEYSHEEEEKEKTKGDSEILSKVTKIITKTITSTEEESCSEEQVTKDSTETREKVIIATTEKTTDTTESKMPETKAEKMPSPSKDETSKPFKSTDDKAKQQSSALSKSETTESTCVTSTQEKVFSKSNICEDTSEIKKIVTEVKTTKISVSDDAEETKCSEYEVHQATDKSETKSDSTGSEGSHSVKKMISQFETKCSEHEKPQAADKSGTKSDLTSSDESHSVKKIISQFETIEDSETIEKSETIKEDKSTISFTKTVVKQHDEDDQSPSFMADKMEPEIIDKISPHFEVPQSESQIRTVTKISTSESTESKEIKEEVATTEEKFVKTVMTSKISEPKTAEETPTQELSPDIAAHEQLSTEKKSKKSPRIVKKKIFVYHTGPESSAEEFLTDDKIREAILASGGKASSTSVTRISSGTTDDIESFADQDDIIEVKSSFEETTTSEHHESEKTETSTKQTSEIKEVETDSFSLITRPFEETFKKRMLEQSQEEQTECAESKTIAESTRDSTREIVEEDDTDTSSESFKDIKIATDAKKLAIERKKEEKRVSHSSTSQERTESETTVTDTIERRTSETHSDIDQAERSQTAEGSKTFSLDEWDKPMGLPSPPDPLEIDDNITSLAKQNTTTSPKQDGNYSQTKHGKSAAENEDASPTKSEGGEKADNEYESSAKKDYKHSDNKEAEKSTEPIYIDLTYVPHFGDPHYCNVDFFRRIRSRYYVFSGSKPSKEVFNALLEAKQEWKDKEAKVTIIPTYETDTLGYWMAVNKEALLANNIDVAPSASRCTINLQDHETSCSAYRLEL